MAATWQQRSGGSSAAHGGNGAAHHWWNAGGTGTADSPPASQPHGGWYDAGGEPAWHRRQRSQRTHDRTLMRVAHASERVQHHHSAGGGQAAHAQGGANANGNGSTCRWCEAAVSAGQRLCVVCVQKALREDELGGPPTPPAVDNTPSDPHSIEQQQAAIRFAMGTLGKAGVDVLGALKDRAAELQERWDQSRPAELRRQSILVNIAAKKEKLAFAVKEETKQRKVLKETRTRMDKLRDEIDDLHEKEGRLAKEMAGDPHATSDAMRDVGEDNPHDGYAQCDIDSVKVDDVMQIKLQVNELMGKVGQMAEVVTLLVNSQMAAPQQPPAPRTPTPPRGYPPNGGVTPSPYVEGRTPMNPTNTNHGECTTGEQQPAPEEVEVLDTEDNDTDQGSKRRPRTRGRPRTRVAGPLRSSGRKDRRSDPMKFTEKEQNEEKEASQQ